MLLGAVVCGAGACFPARHPVRAELSRCVPQPCPRLRSRLREWLQPSGLLRPVPCHHPPDSQTVGVHICSVWMLGVPAAFRLPSQA